MVVIGKTARRCLSLTAAFAWAFVAAGQHASAQTAAQQDLQSLLTAQSVSSSSVFSKPSRDALGVPVGGWLVYPQITVGGIFDDNVYQTSSFRKQVLGIGIRPSFTADYNGGIHKTLVYGNLDARIYPDQSRATTVGGQIGFQQSYEPTPDVVARAFGDFTRSVNISSTGSTLTGSSTVITYPSLVNTFSGGVSAKKSFDRFFIASGVNVIVTGYENATNTIGVPVNLQAQSGVTTQVYVRGGYLVTPLVYAFVEPSGNWQRYRAGGYFDSSGYRIVGGLGTDRISLFRGEVYGGYQEQNFDTPGIGSVSGGIFGGKLFYYPTRDITAQFQLNETIGTSATSTISAGTGVTKTTAAAARVNYELSRAWNAGLTGGYSHVIYIGGARRDDNYSLGAYTSYYFTRNLGISLDYNYNQLRSNVSGVGYNRNVIFAGATYKY